jgi:hypothetical protein
MRAVGRKIICGLLSLLLVVSGQAASTQGMPSAEAASAVSEMSGDCGRWATGHGSGGLHGASGTDVSTACADPGTMACMMSAGQCVMTTAFATSPSLAFSETRSHFLVPGPLFGYQSPFLDVVTPPPDSIS